MINILKKINIYIVCLLPFFLVTGPFLSDLAISLSGIFFLLFAFLENKKHYFYNIFFIIFVSWCFYLIFISVLSDNPRLSLESSLFHFRFGLFALSIWYLLENDKKFVHKFTNFFIIIYILVLFDGYFQFIFGQDIIGNKYEGDRLSGIFAEEKILGSYLARLIPILFALVALVYQNSKKHVYLMMIILICSDILIYLSGERTSFFYLIIASVIIIFFSSNWKIIRSVTLIFSLILVIIISFTHSYTKQRMINLTIKQTNILGDKIKLFSTQHQVVYETSYKIFKENYIFGIGPKMFRETCKDFKTYTEEDLSVDGCQTHPHNTYIQLFVETGIVGTLPIIILFCFILSSFSKHLYFMIFKKRPIYSDYQICLLTAIFITLWPLVPNGNFFNNWINVIYFLPLGFLLHSFNKHSINQ